MSKILFVCLLLPVLAGCGLSQPAGKPTPTSWPPYIPAPRPTAAPDAAATPTVSPAAQVAPFYRPGVAYYPSYNGVRDLAFAPDGALWAATDSGVIRWDLATGTPRRYSVADGLGADYVLAVAVAPDGAVWAGTGGGVSRFDGRTWQNYTADDGLPHNVIYALAVGPDGVVWAGTEAGAGRFTASRWTALTPADGLADHLIWAIGVAADGGVWFSTGAGGVSHYQPQREMWTTYTAREGLPQPNARVLTVGPDAAPWVHVGYDHIYRFDGNAWRKAVEIGGGSWVCDIAFDRARRPWIATCGGWRAYGRGLLHFDGQGWIETKAADGLLSDTVTAIAIRADGVIAAGSDRGISLWQDGKWRALRNGPQLNTITTIAATPAGAVWFGFCDSIVRPAGGGVSRFDGQTWRYSERTDGLHPDASIRALATAPDGQLWAAAGCAVLRGDGARWQAVATCEQLGDSIHAFAFGPRGETWAVGDFNLFQFVGETWRRYEDRVAGPLTVDRQGRVWVWLSPITGGGLAMFDGIEWRTLKEDLPFEFAGALAATADGALWAATGDGAVARFDGSTWQRFGPTDGIPAGPNLRLVLSPAGEVWLIHEGGIVRRAGDAWVRVADGFEGIRAAAFASDGALWLGTARGAVQIKP